MVLSGALKEFILADILNLLTLQKVTGRLALIDDARREGSIIFKDGIVVGSDAGAENLPNKLFNYMVGIKRKSPEHVSQLFDTHAGNLSILSANILERSLMTPKEFKGFAESCVEDICCSLLTWHRGTYRFTSQRSVASLASGYVTIPVENIIMEGMRRVDEWGRMKEYISGDMIFVPAAKNAGETEEIDIAAAPEEYILSLLDGSNTVDSIKKSCCLCEYKVYESIHVLLQAQRIAALQPKYTQSIQAALKRKDAEDASVLGKTFIGSVISVAAAVIVAALFLICRLAVLPAINSGSGAATAEMTDATRAAILLHHAVAGERVDDANALKKAGFLTNKDINR